MSEKDNLFAFINKPVETNAKNIMGCDENWYNSYYAISHTFTKEELEFMSDIEIENLVKLADSIAESLY